MHKKGKIIIKVDKETGLTEIKTRNLPPEDILNAMTESLTRVAVHLGVVKKEVLDATKYYYEETMKYETNK